MTGTQVDVLSRFHWRVYTFKGVSKGWVGWDKHGQVGDNTFTMASKSSSNIQLYEVRQTGTATHPKPASASSPQGPSHSLSSEFSNCMKQ